MIWATIADPQCSSQEKLHCAACVGACFISRYAHGINWYLHPPVDHSKAGATQVFLLCGLRAGSDRAACHLQAGAALLPFALACADAPFWHLTLAACCPLFHGPMQ